MKRARRRFVARLQRPSGQTGHKALKGAAAVGLAAVMLCGSCSVVGGGKSYNVTAYFPKAVSLYKLSKVQVLGLPAGTVTNIEVVGTQVKVSMDIKDSINLPAGVDATIVPQSLIGERYVQLFPAWTEGQPRAAPGEIIPLERTSVPVEPDEALAALKKFLDTLDPKATGRLVTNAAQDLRGNGQNLNDAVKGLAQLSSTLADKDQQLADIVDHFDQFTATLSTRESQLGKVMDQFAIATKLLADERDQVEGLVKGLGQVSKDGLDLVSVHRVQLGQDLDTLTRLLESLNANMDSVRQLLSAGPELVAGNDLTGKHGGLAAAYDPKYHHLDLRSELSPTAAQVFGALGLPTICLPIDVSCTPSGPSSPVPLPGAGSAGQGGVVGPSSPGLPPGAGSAGQAAVTGATTTTTVLPPVSPPPPPTSVLPVPTVPTIPGLTSDAGAVSPAATLFRLMAAPGTGIGAPALGPSAVPAKQPKGWFRRLVRTMVRAL
jgi:phospholipid/cholesterol/gamma-HCH transport system substrate-binding protein